MCAVVIKIEPRTVFFVQYCYCSFKSVSYNGAAVININGMFEFIIERTNASGKSVNITIPMAGLRRTRYDGMFFL